MRVPVKPFDDESMPAELRLDLLVDGELGEQQRRELLSAMERAGDGAAWKQLAVRFLERQTEKESVRQLMVGGSVVPAEVMNVKRSVIGHVGGWRLLATAAGLLIAVMSALVTLYAVRPVNATRELMTNLPAEATASDSAVPVSVHMVKAAEGSQFMPAGVRRSTRSSVIIQPDGNGGAIVIPVSTVKAPVY